MDKITGNRMNNNFKPNQKNLSTFQVVPLDVNVAQMQINLQKRIEREVPENGNFSPILEKYDNNDQSLNISDINVICKSSSENRDEREILTEIVNRARTHKYSYVLFSGNKKQLLEYINSGDNIFFETIKQFAFYVSKQNERKS